MNPKIVLTVIAVLNALHGILWIFFLPLPEMSEEAILIGSTYGKIVGCFNLVIFSILFFSRDLETSSAKRILVGGGVGFLFLNALTINNGIIKAEELGELATPLPIIVVWALVTVWMLSAGLRKAQS
tara:strand:- start:14 stop:394 length:381 start_codon:yes stop_codon:yes gene_type:complete